MANKGFINPYNFMPLSDKAPDRGKVEKVEKVKKRNYSGVIIYSLRTKTPLFIPNTSNKDAFNKKVDRHTSYDFFSYNDLSKKESVEKEYFEPVIPGSSVRGMLRSYYEMLTNSCLSSFDDEDETLLNTIGEHYACKSNDELCPACRLFGTIEGDSKTASRVRVGDVRLKDCDNYEKVYEEIKTLTPLSSPRKSAMEFYVKKPAENAKYWTYDEHIDADGVTKKEASRINGRKFYWHNPNFKMEELEECQPSKMNSTIRAVKSGQLFKGKIYFNHLTKEELNELIYAINAGDDGDLDEKKGCYKLGQAKPLGFGSVAMKIDEVKIRKLDLNDELKRVQYSIEDYDEYEQPAFNSTIEKQFAVITNFEKLLEKNIQYPQLDVSKSYEESPVYEWFNNNRKNQQLYREYMKALEPELVDNIKEVRITGIAKNGTLNFDDNGKRGSVFYKDVGKKEFKIGDFIEVIFSHEKQFPNGPTRYYKLASDNSKQGSRKKRK